MRKTCVTFPRADFRCDAPFPPSTLPSFADETPVPDRASASTKSHGRVHARQSAQGPLWRKRAAVCHRSSRCTAVCSGRMREACSASCIRLGRTIKHGDHVHRLHQDATCGSAVSNWSRWRGGVGGGANFWLGLLSRRTQWPRQKGMPPEARCKTTEKMHAPNP